MLLGEQLIAFRDTDGRVGIMEQSLPASLRLAVLRTQRGRRPALRLSRLEFDVEGNCLDMPNVPPAQDFKARIKAKATRWSSAQASSGPTWARARKRRRCQHRGPDVAGARALPPACTSASATGSSRSKATSTPSHFGFLHVGGVKTEDVDPETINKWAVGDRAPDYKSTETEWGTMYAAYRPAEPHTYYYRFAHFLFPFITLTPNGFFEDQVACTLNVPMDDTHTMTYNLTWKKKTRPLETLKNGEWIPGLEPKVEYLPDTNDWYGRHRLAARRENDYLIDRDMQKNVNYTGIRASAGRTRR